MAGEMSFDSHHTKSMASANRPASQQGSLDRRFLRLDLEVLPKGG